MSFSSYIARTDGDLAFFVTARIAGIPYIFSNLRTMPTSWTLPTGTAWSGTLQWFADGEKFEAISQVADLKNGISTSGTCRLTFISDPLDTADVWLDLLAPSTQTRWTRSASQMVTPRADDRWWTLIDATGISATNVLYSGVETVYVDSVSAPQIQVTRGYLDSPRQWYGPRGKRGQGAQEEISDFPQVWRGRVVELWLHCASVGRSGELVPMGADLSASGYAAAPEARQIFRGPVYDVGFDGGSTTVTLTAQSLDQLMERPCISRGRQYQLGPHLTGTLGWVWIEEGGPSRAEFSHHDSGGGGIQRDTWVDLQTGANSSGSALITAIPDQPIPASTAGAAVAAGMTASLYDSANHRVVVRYEIVEGDDGKAYSQFSAQSYNGGLALLSYPLVFRVTTAQHPHLSIFPALGFDEDFELGPASQFVSGGPWGVGAVIRSPNPIPFYHLCTTNTHVLYRGAYSPDSANAVKSGDPPDRQNTISEAGNLDGVGVRLGSHEICTGDFRRGSTVYDTFGASGADSYGGFLPAFRASRPRPLMISVPQDDTDGQDYQITLGLYFADHHLMDILRIIACSDGTVSDDPEDHDDQWRRLYEGFGCAIPSDYFDHQSFDEVREAYPDARATGWWIGEGESLRDIAAMVAVAYGLVFLPTTDDTGRLRIAVREIAPGATSDTPEATIDSSWMSNTLAPVTAVKSERDVVNRIEFAYNYDAIEGKYLSKNNESRDVTSMSLYGPTEAFKIELPWIRTASDAIARLEDIGSHLFAIWGRPVVRITVPCVTPRLWALQVGDLVALTHPYLPDYYAGGRGLTAKPMEVEGKTENFGPGSETFGELSLLWRITRRHDRYCPSLRLWFREGTSAEYYIRPEEFSAVGASDLDVAAYSTAVAEAWSVTVALEYDRSTIVTRTIMAITVAADGTTSVTFSSALTAGLHADMEACIVEFSPSATVAAANEVQEDYAYCGDASTFTVPLDSGTREATRWL